MTFVTQLESTTSIQIVRFVSCCDGTEILFRGFPSLITGGVYHYIGATPINGEGGQLIPNQCYTVYEELTSDPITYPATPTAAQFSTILEGCEDKTCPDCNPESLCECPEGFTYNEITELCERETETIAEYSGTLLPVVAGSRNEAYCDFGLRLYPDITNLVWPILGTGPNNAGYTLNQNNGTGPVVIPTANIQNEAFGSNIAGCSTSSIGGRLNKAGIWATGFPNNQELSFEFCIEIVGAKKQYMIGLAGDNYVRFYIDGSLAVDLNSPGSGVTTPFRHWHTFPITLGPGTHTIKLSGLNFGSAAAFAAEIYDITLTDFQANLMYPAVGSGNCGSTEAQLEPYIIFSTRDYIGQSISNPNTPGVWTCPGGEPVDFCNGIPVCKILETIPLACDCYLIIPCDGTNTFTSIDKSYEDYINTFVEVSGPEYTGCAYVVKTEYVYCNDSTATTVPTRVACDCELRCWWVENSNGFFIVNENNEFIAISALDAAPYIKVCSKIQPIPEEGTNLDILNIQELGSCEETGTCPELCFILTNCSTEEVIYSNSDVLFQYTFSQNTVVEIIGKDGCWYVEQGDPLRDPCDCLVDITVIRSYQKCEDCIKPIYYRLNSCDNNTVIYSQLNLEEYIGKVIKTDCGCFEVELINYTPPNTQLIKLEGVYDTCLQCTRVYYELVDCQGIADNIYTYTDLSLLVGQTIKVENCKECWIVNEVDNAQTIYANAGTVNVTDTYVDCDTCSDDLVCTCSQVTNYSEDIIRNYQYLNCDNEIVSITLNPGESSGRICLLKWIATPLFCSCIQFKLKGESYYAFIVPNQLFNDKPFYTLCTFGDLTECGYVYWDGSNWVISDSNDNPTWILPISTSSVCPYGDWEGYNQEVRPNPIEEKTRALLISELTSQPCDLDICTCITLTTDSGNTSTFYVVAIDIFGNPIYSDGLFTIEFQPKSNCWVYGLDNSRDPYYLCGLNLQCPIGNWESASGSSFAVSVECPVEPAEFTMFDYFETFGECKYGVCPPRIFPNKRVITPGYNTPICTPEKYDMITCNFADIMYKLALEKRYGISNCCPEEDDKWLIKKELIDLQALKDPNYKCAECSCGCLNTNTCSTCNCKK